MSNYCNANDANGIAIVSLLKLISMSKEVKAAAGANVAGTETNPTNAVNNAANTLEITVSCLDEVNRMAIAKEYTAKHGGYLGQYRVVSCKLIERAIEVVNSTNGDITEKRINQFLVQFNPSVQIPYAVEYTDDGAIVRDAKGNPVITNQTSAIWISESEFDELVVAYNVLGTSAKVKADFLELSAKAKALVLVGGIVTVFHSIVEKQNAWRNPFRLTSLGTYDAKHPFVINEIVEITNVSL